MNLLFLLAIATQWLAPPDDRVMAGTEPVLVEAPDGGAWLLSVDDASGDKSSTLRLDPICRATCTWMGFLDTRLVSQGEHTLYLFDQTVSTTPQAARTVQVDPARPVERPFVWPDPLNPWPQALEGPGQVQVMVWVANLGTAPEEVRLELQARGVRVTDLWDVRSNVHFEDGRWTMGRHESRQLLATLEVEEAAARGTTLRWTARTDAEVARWDHTLSGWEAAARQGPVPLALVPLAVAALAARRRKPHKTTGDYIPVPP